MKSFCLLIFTLLFCGCNQTDKRAVITQNTTAIAKTFEEKLSDAAISVIDPSVDYDPANFSKYPNLQKWGMTKTDTNIDHRRVPNLEIFFE